MRRPRSFQGVSPRTEVRVPCLSDEPGWGEVTDEERESILGLLRDLGLEFPEDSDDEEPEYYE
jgi:hypothetical protein